LGLPAPVAAPLPKAAQSSRAVCGDKSKGTRHRTAPFTCTNERHNFVDRNRRNFVSLERKSTPNFRAFRDQMLGIFSWIINMLCIFLVQDLKNLKISSDV
jgi:hypothetical protein